MNTLRRLALVCSLLIVGILIAPGPSEATPPTLTISVDFGSPATLTLTAGSGTACPLPTGYTNCYNIPVSTSTFYGSGTHRFTLQNVSSTNPARVLIADTTGAGSSLDQFTLTGVRFVPESGTDEFGLHTVQMVFTNTFNAAPNPVGNYLFALRTGGYFVAGSNGTGNPVDNLNNSLKFAGSGNFGFGAKDILGVPPVTTNLTPLSMQVTGPASTTVSFSLGQVQPFPVFNCNTGSSQCSPTITLTLTFVVVGRDTLFLTNSADAGGGTCVTPPPAPSPKSQFKLPKGPVTQCQAEGNLASTFSQYTNADNKSASQAGAVPCEAACYVVVPKSSRSPLP